jgi:hypothetical protein
MSIITSTLLKQQGWLKFHIELPAIILQNIREQNYPQLDDNVSQLLDPTGKLYSILNDLVTIKKTEFILTLRQAPDDEDGIWHDDGSRQLAFSLGLNQTINTIEGGQIELRNKSDSTCHQFAPLAWGEVLVFLTGLHHWEHRVLAVTKGTRLHMAGWIN